jgi:hypothetical protein
MLHQLETMRTIKRRDGNAFITSSPEPKCTAFQQHADSLRTLHTIVNY